VDKLLASLLCGTALNFAVQKSTIWDTKGVTRKPSLCKFPEMRCMP
jgi:hypothetical protein